MGFRSGRLYFGRSLDIFSIFQKQRGVYKLVFKSCYESIYISIIYRLSQKNAYIFNEP